MCKVLSLVYILFLNGCTIGPNMSVSLERDTRLCQNAIYNNNYWFAGLNRQRCLQRLNYNYVNYSSYLGSCQGVLNRYKYSWTKIDKRTTEYAKENNESLPENFKTTEEIFATYPNPCQDNDQFWKQVKEYEKNEKQKVK